MGVMPDHIQVITVFVISRMADLNVVDLSLQRRFLGGVIGLHRHKFRVI